MFNICPLWLCPWKGTASTGPRGEVFQKSPIFPTERASKPGSWHTLGSHAPNFTLGHCGWAEKPYRGIPGPFQALSQLDLLGLKPATPHFTSRGNNEILFQKASLLAVGLLLWLGARKHWCRCKKYSIYQAPLYQPPNYPPKIGCRTGYATTPPLW